MTSSHFLKTVQTISSLCFVFSCCAPDTFQKAQVTKDTETEVNPFTNFAPRKTVLDFPAPKWEVGDWWDIILQNYITPTRAKRQPLGDDLKEGWASLQRWHYEIIGTEIVRGDDCFVVRITKGGHIFQMWHRKSDRLLMRQTWDSKYNEEQRVKIPRDAWKSKPIVRETNRIEPIGRAIYSPPPLATPVFGEAYEGMYNQRSEEIEKEKILQMTNDKLRDRIRPLLEERSAKITITSAGGSNPDDQYWNTGLPWCVYGHIRTSLPSRTDQSRYWLVDFGKKGETP